MVSRTLSGEAYVAKLFHHYAMLCKPGIVGDIFAPPGAIVGLMYDSSVKTILAVGDVVVFEADAQENRNGARWCARPMSVRKLRGAEIYDGSGTVVELDKNTGHFGFAETARGLLFFTALAARPPTRDLANLFCKQQKVRFRALPHHDPIAPWRAIFITPVVLNPISRVLCANHLKPTKPIGSATFSQVVSTLDSGGHDAKLTEDRKRHEYRLAPTSALFTDRSGVSKPLPLCRPLDQILHGLVGKEHLRTQMDVAGWKTPRLQLDDCVLHLCYMLGLENWEKTVFCVHPNALSVLAKSTPNIGLSHQLDKNA